MLTYKVIEFNKLNTCHDYTYMYSDDNRCYIKGSQESNILESLYNKLSDEEKDLVGLYNNFILKRNSPQFCYIVRNLENSKEEALKYYG